MHGNMSLKFIEIVLKISRGTAIFSYKIRLKLSQRKVSKTSFDISLNIDCISLTSQQKE
jgi:hypothetical protein